MGKPGEIHYILEGTVTDLPAFTDLVTGLVASVESDEPGTLVYEYVVDETTGRAIVHERFADAEAYLTHIRNLRPHLGELFGLIAVDRTVVLGEIEDERVLKAMAALSPAVHRQVAGLTR